MLHLAALGKRVILTVSSAYDGAPSAAWQRLWCALHGDATGTCFWRREEGRLVCQLEALSDADLKNLECEPLADAPDIELCILHRPNTAPRLAQVIFGPQRSFQCAFEFMMREVQEFPLQALGRTSWWQENEACVVRCLGPREAPIVERIAIEAGLTVCAALAADGSPRIARIEFERSAGWDRARAHSWLAQRSYHGEPERTACLQRSYRFDPTLDSVVQGVIAPRDWLPPIAERPTSGERSIEFLPIPGSPRAAGSEIDLSAPRPTDRLPAGLGHGLPPRGFINYAEAQALVARLESIARKDVNGHACHIAVMALWESQVELLRRLIAQSEVLRSSRCALHVALPSRLPRREYDLAFLSLTRSQSKGAAAFCQDVAELPPALTRARASLFVFGDASALAKRIEHKNAIAPLDTRAAEQERVILARLAAALLTADRR
jgi:hypothetical protein